MTAHTKIAVLCMLIGVCLGGCQVTEEKIVLWKSTRNGPEKIATVLKDTDAPIPLRAAAAVALIELKQHALLSASFQSISAQSISAQSTPPGEGDAVILAAMKTLSAQIQNASADSRAVTSTQINAKDGVFLLYGFSGPKSKKAVEDALVAWCTGGNFRTRERAGFSIRVIAQKVGSPIYAALANGLNVTQDSLEPISQLIKESGDKVILQRASQKIASELNSHQKEISVSHLTAAAIIGGSPVGDFLCAVAADQSLYIELRKHALRAYSIALEQGSISPSVAQTTLLVKVAEDASQDDQQREEAYLTLAQIHLPQSVSALEKLLEDDEFFWRMTGARCLLRMDGKKHLQSILQSSKVVEDVGQTNELISLIATFSDIKSEIIAALQSPHTFSVGVAIGVLSRLGSSQDIPQLEKYRNRPTKLPGVFPVKTVGAAASDAIVAIEKKG